MRRLIVHWAALAIIALTSDVQQVLHATLHLHSLSSDSGLEIFMCPWLSWMIAVQNMYLVFIQAWLSDIQTDRQTDTVVPSVFWHCWLGNSKIIIYIYISLSLSLSLSNGHFPGETGLAGVYWSKGWWRWRWQLNYWSYKSCKAPVKSSPPTN